MSEAPRFLRHRGRSQSMNEGSKTEVSRLDYYRPAPEDIRVILHLIQLFKDRLVLSWKAYGDILREDGFTNILEENNVKYL